MTRPPLSPPPRAMPPGQGPRVDGPPFLTVLSGDRAPAVRADPVGCPLCGNTTHTVLWSGRLDVEASLELGVSSARSWIRCTECSLARVAHPVAGACGRGPAGPAPSAARFAEEVAQADEEISRIRAVGHGDAWRRRGAALPQPRLLEIGCDHGSFLAAAGWRGFAAVGTEADPAAARWCARHVEAEVHTGGMAPGLAQGPFDVIVYRPALDSVLDPMGVLRELSGALVTDGLLVVSVHVRDHPVHRLKGAADGLWTEPERRVCFDRQSLALSLLRSGLQPQRLDHAPHRPGMVTVFARRDPR